jgi:ribosomal-protein-alanine N-acetyltransferase
MGPVLKSIPQITTERLCLRGITLADVADIFEYASNPRVLETTAARTPRTLEETERFVASVVMSGPHDFEWAIRLKGQSKVVGIIELALKSALTTADVHYALAEEHWNQGLTTEACKAVLAWAFRTHPSLRTVRTGALVENVGSRRVLEKSGMKLERTMPATWEKRDQPVELAVYSVDRSDMEE